MHNTRDQKAPTYLYSNLESAFLFNDLRETRFIDPADRTQPAPGPQLML